MAVHGRQWTHVAMYAKKLEALGTDITVRGPGQPCGHGGSAAVGSAGDALAWLVGRCTSRARGRSVRRLPPGMRSERGPPPMERSMQERVEIRSPLGVASGLHALAQSKYEAASRCFAQVAPGAADTFRSMASLEARGGGGGGVGGGGGYVGWLVSAGITLVPPHFALVSPGKLGCRITSAKNNEAATVRRTSRRGWLCARWRRWTGWSCRRGCWTGPSRASAWRRCPPRGALCMLSKP